MVIIRSPLEPRLPVSRVARRPAAGPFAWPAISVVAPCTALALLVEAWRQDYHGDELYFLSAAQHLSWGYADQGALVPFLAWLGEGSPLTLRIPAVLATVVGVVLTALLAREFGGGRWAQTAAAAAYAASPRVLDTGSLLLTQTFDIPLWIATTLLLVRWARTGSDRLWWGMGLLAGVAFTVKPLIAVFWACCVAVLLATRRRSVPWAGLGKLPALAVAGALPYLIWQGFHGFPQLTLIPVVAQETGEFAGGNCAGLFPVCWAAAAARISTAAGSRWWRRIALVGVSAFSGAVVLATSLLAGGPSSPAWATAATLEVRAEQGWSGFTDAVATAYHHLPPATTIVTDHYWQASALNCSTRAAGCLPHTAPTAASPTSANPGTPRRRSCSSAPTRPSCAHTACGCRQRRPT